MAFTFPPSLLAAAVAGIVVSVVVVVVRFELRLSWSWGRGFGVVPPRELGVGTETSWVVKGVARGAVEFWFTWREAAMVGDI